MTNVTMTEENNVLTIKVDLSERHGRSASGKTEIIASTRGNISVPNHPEIKLGVNCYTK